MTDDPCGGCERVDHEMRNDYPGDPGEPGTTERARWEVERARRAIRAHHEERTGLLAQIKDLRESRVIVRPPVTSKAPRGFAPLVTFQAAVTLIRQFVIEPRRTWLTKETAEHEQLRLSGKQFLDAIPPELLARPGGDRGD